MPRGPKGDRLPPVIGNTSLESQGKDPAAVALGRKGGKARAAAMSRKRRKEIAQKAAASRWKQGRNR